jgi:uncharacterized protein (UPF0305 family)
MKRKQDGFDEAMDDIQRQKRLTVAAPQMLEALKKAYTCMSIPDHIRDLIRDAIHAATLDPERVKREGKLFFCPYPNTRRKTTNGCDVCPHKGHKPCAKCEGCAYL